MQIDGKIEALQKNEHPFIAKYVEEFVSDNN